MQQFEGDHRWGGGGNYNNTKTGERKGWSVLGFQQNIGESLWHWPLPCFWRNFARVGPKSKNGQLAAFPNSIQTHKSPRVPLKFWVSSLCSAVFCTILTLLSMTTGPSFCRRIFTVVPGRTGGAGVCPTPVQPCISAVEWCLLWKVLLHILRLTYHIWSTHMFLHQLRYTFWILEREHWKVLQKMEVS